MDASEIARRLSKAQRRAILLADETISGDFKVPVCWREKEHHAFIRISFPTLRNLESFRLIHGCYPAFLTELGLAVRRILSEERGNGQG